MAFSGKFVPTNPNKYRGNPTNIMFRSLLERRFMIFCDTHPSILAWNYEKVVIPYICNTDGKPHRYFVDFWMLYQKSDGSVVECLVEIKPKSETKPPAPPKTNSQKSKGRFLREMFRYAKNSAKWEAAEKWCSHRGMNFKIITEEDLKDSKVSDEKRAKKRGTK